MLWDFSYFILLIYSEIHKNQQNTCMIDSRKIVDIPHPPVLTKNTEKTAT